MPGALRELLAAFKISVDSDELKRADAQITGFTDRIKKVGAVIAEAFAVRQISQFVEGQARIGTQLAITADRLGLTTQALQAFHLAAEEIGIGSESMDTALRFLSRNLAEAAGGAKEQSEVFQNLGIQVKDAGGKTRPVADVFADLSEKVAGLNDPALKVETAMKLLGRGGAEVIPILNRGSKAFEEARARVEALGGGMSGDFVEGAKKTTSGLADLKVASQGLASQFALALFPGFDKAVAWLTRWAVSAVQLAKETTGLSSAVEFFGAIAGVKLVGSLLSLAKIFGILQPTIAGTARAFLGFAWPLAVAGLLYLLFDDLYALMSGGESVIGDTLDHFFGLGTATKFAKDLNEAFAATADLVQDIGSFLESSLIEPLKAAAQLLAGDVAGAQATMAAAQKKNFEAQANIGDDLSLSTEGRDRKRGRGRYADVDEAKTDLGNGKSAVVEGLRDRDTEEAQAERGEFSGPPRAREEEKTAWRAKQADAAGEAAGTPAMLRRPEEQQIAVPKNWLGDASYQVAPAPAPSPPINQTNTFNTTVHTSSDDPKAVGDAAGRGIATPVERANVRLRTAGAKP